MIRYLILGLFSFVTGSTDFVIDSVVNKPITPQAHPEYFLQDSVPNPDVRGKLLECDKTKKTDPCILYLKNTSKFDRMAEDFFEEAGRQTGRARYLIHIENQHYAKHVIAPEKSAAIRIPPLR